MSNIKTTMILYRAFTATTATATLSGMYLWYDYKTCHPMRKLKYEPREALVRFHNSLVTNLGVAKTIPLHDLQTNFNGTGGKPTYISAGGRLYDVSTSQMFQSTYQKFAGQDATLALAKMSLDSSDISVLDATLTPQEQKSLQSWMDYFDEKYYIKGNLQEYKNNQPQQPQQKQQN